MFVERCRKCGVVWVASTTEEIDCMRMVRPCECAKTSHKEPYDGRETNGRVREVREAV